MKAPDLSRLPAPVRRALAEPLLHFLMIGALIFGAYAATHPTASDERTIVVDRASLLTFLQYRAKAFDEPYFARALDTMSPRALQDLIDDYVREEAMYREAKALKLDEGDYYAKRRLVQQLEFTTQGFIDDARPLSDAEVAKYYEAHKSDYFREATLTFTHVFFDRSKRGEGAEAAARAKLAELNAAGTPFDQAMAHGDRPLYAVNYVQRELSVVVNDFGKPMAEKLLALTPSQTRWQGPFESKHGFALVMLTGVTKGATPPLEEIRELVATDAAEADKRERVDQAVRALIKDYRVKLGPIQRKPAEPTP